MAGKSSVYMEGTLSLSPICGGLKAEEELRFLADGKELTGRSCQRWMTYPESTVKVFREEDELFYLFNLHQGAEQSISYLCGEDTYRGGITLLLPKAFTLSFRVAGPKKRYSTFTRYEKL